MATPSSLHEFLRMQMLNPSPLLPAMVEANLGAISRLSADRVRPEAAAFLRLLREFPARSGQRLARFRRCLPLVAKERAIADQEDWPLAPQEVGRRDTEDKEPWALDFRLPRHRLALLPAELILRLARYFGLVRFRAEIAGLIRREEILALRSEVGQEGHLFALRRTALLSFPTDLSWTSVSPSAWLDTSVPLPLRVRRSGFMAIAACLADAPETVFRLASRAAGPELAEFLLAARRSRPATCPWSLLSILLGKEVATAWSPCFT